LNAKLKINSTSKVFFVLIALISMNAWSDIKSKQEIGDAAKSKAPHISSRQLSDYLTDKEDFVLLDIRTEGEYQAGHIEGAQWFARGRLEYYIQDLIKDPDTKIVLYCRTGGRSALGTLTLQDMGYTNVVDLNGGFKGWVEDGNTFYNLHGESRVVTYQKKE
jgi:rhodanese-related sulfurtransferase